MTEHHHDESEMRPGAIEPFRCLSVNAELVGPEQQPSLPGVQLMLALVGNPAYALPGPKHYLTFLDPAIGLQVGDEISRVCREHVGDGQAAHVEQSGILIADEAGMRAAAAQHDEIARLRG